jgi:membrane dipeptidase
MNPLLPIFDGHNDTLLRLYRPEPGQERSFFERGEIGHLDLPRARAGGFAGGFFAVFVPNRNWVRRTVPRGTSGAGPKGDTADPYGWYTPLPPRLDRRYALQFATGMTARLFRLEAESQGLLRVARTVGDVESCLEDGVVAAVLHFEGAEAIDGDLDALHVFHQAGLRSLGPVWSRPNRFAHGVPFNFPDSPDIGPGLTAAGKRLVRECNQLGVLVDVSHMNERGFWDVASVTDAPLVATHSAAHALCPSPRNLTDRQLDAIADSGGIVGVNFHVAFTRSDGRADRDTSLAEIVRHIHYVVDRTGIDYVGFGSDFDGATMPGDLRDVARLPKLVEALRREGYEEHELRRMAYENWLRVLRATWKDVRYRIPESAERSTG